MLRRYSITNCLLMCCILCTLTDSSCCKQDLAPRLHIHSISDLSLLQTVNWGTEAGYAALAFSGDGRRLAAIEQELHSRLIVWDWREVNDNMFLPHRSLPVWLHSYAWSNLCEACLHLPDCLRSALACEHKQTWSVCLISAHGIRLPFSKTCGMFRGHSCTVARQNMAPVRSVSIPVIRTCCALSAMEAFLCGNLTSMQAKISCSIVQCKRQVSLA